jgi:16S rRNA (guanine966-N2)-methyltransferase
MFASLDHLLGGFVGARVLDLFAGSGALGLEAASRGAAAVVLVERDRPSAEVARANVGVVGVAGIRVVASSVAVHLSGQPEPFDLVLADPPYANSAAEVEGFLTALTQGWLAPDAVVMVERATRGGGFRWPPGVVALRQRAYGGTTLWYGQSAYDGEDP